MDDGRGGQITGIAGNGKIGRKGVFLKRKVHAPRGITAFVPPDAILLRRGAPPDPGQAAFGDPPHAGLRRDLLPVVACIGGASWPG
ncbi:hypothetical protein ACDP63_00085 [Paracoccus sp. P2]|uniref:Uncharacterized protein n=1 Tax=Paracoccus pantotrophus TaxID=82367 RepID=A0A7H9BQA3_PARPN|nr:hypothetical protein [Paracoccus pantotrophus]MDF3854030.1 hypothetical protein [Paracoccus pantotrophus]QLH13223.1 hypothetical protein HYQ43_02715 [Paracoccus pantotrophus]WGR66798.1 hypothetical protein E3U24_16115 [Paracoccus pantotrophus]